MVFEKILQMKILNINDSSQTCYARSYKIDLNHTYYFFDDIKDIDLNWLRIIKKCMKNTDAFVY